MPNEIGQLTRLSETGEKDVQILVPREDFYIGSDRGKCQIRIVEDNISERHCVIRAVNSLASVYSLNSEHPVFLNHKAVSNEGSVIRNGDEIRINKLVFRWEYIVDTKCFRSLPLEDSPIPQNPGRYSLPIDSLEYYEKNKDENKDEIEQAKNTTSQDLQSVKEDNLATPEMPVKKPYISTSCKINRSSLACENKAERLTQTCVKPKRSRMVSSKNFIITKNTSEERIEKKIDTHGTPVKKINDVTSRRSQNASPFGVSNIFIAESKKETVEGLCKERENESECDAKSALDDMFDEDMITNHSKINQPYHSTPKPEVHTKRVDNATSPLSSSVDFDFEVSQDEVSKLKATGSGVTKDVSDIVEGNAYSANVDFSKTTPVRSMKSKISTESLRSKNSTFKKAFNEISCDGSLNLDVSLTKIEEGKGDSTTSKSLNVSAPTRRTFESNESRRNTRGRTSMLRKTFEEKAYEDDALNKERSLTTPEKSTEISVEKSRTFNTQSGIETSVNVKLPSTNCESSKSGFASISDENDTCESSFIDKYKICNVLKNSPGCSVATVAKCARNLSCFSPPENNRSQEYMDSIVSTPKKSSAPSPHQINDSYNVSLSSLVSPSKDSSFNELILSPLSSTRKRRSTGFTPCVGTPSNVYRTTRKVSTPFNKSYLSRTSTDFEALDRPLRGGKWSTERRSTPFKVSTRKSSIRDSMPMHPTIEEIEAYQDDENEPMNDSKFKFVTVRRQRRCAENSFASENRILEESESKSEEDMDYVSEEGGAEEEEEENDGTFEEGNSETTPSMRIADYNTTLAEDTADISTMDKTKLLESKKNAAVKSILTPGPKSLSSAVKKSAKKVTFELPDSPESLAAKENTFDANGEESFAMISARKVDASEDEPVEPDITLDEELYVADETETEISGNSTSYTESTREVSVVESEDEKHEKFSVSQNASLNATFSDEVEVSGVERINSPNPLPHEDHVDEVPDASVGESCSSDVTSNIWKGEVSMPRIAKFEAVLTRICGDCDLNLSLQANIECVGRIDPNSVWQYLPEMKENKKKAISVFRFEPPEIEQTSDYTKLFDYLYTNDRMAVVGNGRDGDEIYIMALPKHTPLPEVLLSSDLPNHQVDEFHSLLAIVVQIRDCGNVDFLSSKSLSNEKNVNTPTEFQSDLSQPNDSAMSPGRVPADTTRITSEIRDAGCNEAVTNAKAMDNSPCYSSNVCLSGIKNLFTTPLETPTSKTTRNNVGGELTDENDELIPNVTAFSPEACLSGVKSLMKTPEILETSTAKGGKRILNFEVDRRSATVSNTIAAVRSSARKSEPNEQKLTNKPSRRCKSLVVNEATRRKTFTEKETSTSSEVETESVSGINQLKDIPTIMITEATFVENQNVTLSEELDVEIGGDLANQTVTDEPIEPAEVQTPLDESVESAHIEKDEEEYDCHVLDQSLSSNKLTPEQVEIDQFETSDCEETLSSEDGILDPERPVSPVISPRRYRSTSKVSLLMLASDKNLAKSLDLSALVSSNEKSPNLSNSSQVSLDCSKELGENDLSKSSLEVAISERSSSRLSDLSYADETNTIIDLKGNTEDDVNESLESSKLEEKTQTPKPTNISIESQSESESKRNSQEIYMKLDVSSELVHDLEEQLGSAYCSSNEPTKPNSPVGASRSNEIFKIPMPVDLNSRLANVSVQRNDVDVTESEWCSRELMDTTDRVFDKNEKALNVSDVSDSKMNKTCYTPFDKFKTSILNESPRTLSPLRRCRNSLRLHRAKCGDTPDQSSNHSDHDCSILSNDSSISDPPTDIVEEPKQLYKHVIEELSTKVMGIKEKLDSVETIEISDRLEIPHVERLNDSISVENPQVITVCPENNANAESADLSEIIDVVESSQINPSNEIQTKISTVSETRVEEVFPCQSQYSIENHDRLAANRENNVSIEEAGIAALPSDSSTETDIQKNTASADEVSDVSSVASQNEIPVITIGESMSANERNENSPVQKSLKQKRNLRVRKDKQSPEIEKKIENVAGIATRDRRKRVNETKKLQTSLKTNLKKAAVEHGEIHDDKENVCTLTGVVSETQSKKVKLSTQGNETTVPSLADKRRMKQSRNVEYTVVETKPTTLRTRAIFKKAIETAARTKRKRSHTPEDKHCKKPCSIILPVLDPEIINSPVKVDEAGNITVIKSPEVSTKTRSARLAKKAIAAEKDASHGSTSTVTKQRLAKTVSFKNYSPPSTRRKRAAVKNPVVPETSESAMTAPAKRSTRVQLKNTEVEVKESETKSRPKRTAKDSRESSEDVVVVEPPKRTRGRPRTTAAIIEPQPLLVAENTNRRGKRGVRSMVAEQEISSSRDTKNNLKTTEANFNKNMKTVAEASTSGEIVGRNLRNIKIAEKVQVLVDDILLEKGPQKTTRRKAINVEAIPKKPADAIEASEPRTRAARATKTSTAAVKSKAMSTGTIRTKKNKTSVSEIVDNTSRITRTKKKEASISKIEDSEKPKATSRGVKKAVSNEIASSTNATRKPTPRAATGSAKERARVITRSKKVSLTRNGRVSLVLRTSIPPARTRARKTRASRIVSTAVSPEERVSSPEVVVSKPRVTRKRVK